jgi:AcrR family transcriptional regulator
VSAVVAALSTSVRGVTGPAQPATRRRNPRGQGDRLRDEIVTAAALLLDETGSSEAVTLRAVARRAGISAPSIYRHFPDAQAILLVIAQEAFAQLGRRLAEAADTEPDDPTARLVRVAHAYLAFAEKTPSQYRVMFGGLWTADLTRGDAITQADVTALGQETIDVLTNCLVDCITAGTSTSTDPHTDVIALWLGLHGLAHQRAVIPHFPWPQDIEIRTITLLASLARA